MPNQPRKHSIVLHIGVEKAGSTAMQGFFESRRDFFASDFNLHYPTFLGRPSHVWLPYVAMNKQKESNLTRRLNLSSKVDPDRARSDKVLELESWLDSIPQGTVLFSSEHLSSHLTSPSEVERLRDVLERNAKDFLVICYLREQLSASVSRWSTAIKSGSRAVEMPRPSDYYDYWKLLGLWESVFPGDVQPLIYPGNQASPTRIIEDFLVTLGISDLVVTGLPKHTNKSLSWASMRVLAQLNCDLPVFTESGNVRASRKEVVKTLEVISIEADKYTPTQLERLHFERYYADSNERVRRRYFPERADLWDGISESFQEASSPSCSVREEELEIALRIINHLASVIDDGKI